MSTHGSLRRRWRVTVHLALVGDYCNSSPPKMQGTLRIRFRQCARAWVLDVPALPVPLVTIFLAVMNSRC